MGKGGGVGSIWRDGERAVAAASGPAAAMGKGQRRRSLPDVRWDSCLPAIVYKMKRIKDYIASEE